MDLKSERGHLTTINQFWTMNRMRRVYLFPPTEAEHRSEAGHKYS
jgi:hypothetical protein